MSDIKIRVALLVLVIAGLTLGILLVPKASRKPPTDTRLYDYCSAVSAALAADARDFDSGNPVRRGGALVRFGEPVTFHSEPEILLCANVPPDLRERDRCGLQLDYTCLSKLARAAAESTKP